MPSDQNITDVRALVPSNQDNPVIRDNKTRIRRRITSYESQMKSQREIPNVDDSQDYSCRDDVRRPRRKTTMCAEEILEALREVEERCSDDISCETDKINRQKNDSLIVDFPSSSSLVDTFAGLIVDFPKEEGSDTIDKRGRNFDSGPENILRRLQKPFLEVSRPIRDRLVRCSYSIERTK